MKSLSAPTRFAIQSNVDFRVYEVYLNATWSPSPSLKLQHRQTTENRSSVSINDTKRGRDFQHSFLLRHTTLHIFWYKQPVWQISLCMCVCVCVCVCVRVEIYLLFNHTLAQETGCVVNTVVHILVYVFCVLPENSTRGHTRELRPYRTSRFAWCKWWTWEQLRRLLFC